MSFICVFLHSSKVIQDALFYKMAASNVHCKPHLGIAGITKDNWSSSYDFQICVSYNFMLTVGWLLEMFT